MKPPISVSSKWHTFVLHSFTFLLNILLIKRKKNNNFAFLLITVFIYTLRQQNLSIVFCLVVILIYHIHIIRFSSTNEDDKCLLIRKYNAIIPLLIQLIKFKLVISITVVVLFQKGYTLCYNKFSNKQMKIKNKY